MDYQLALQGNSIKMYRMIGSYNNFIIKDPYFNVQTDYNLLLKEEEVIEM